MKREASNLSFLKDLGLTDNDIALYVALVEMGSSFLTAIARQANVNRTSAYYMLEKLMKMGLVKIDVRAGKRKHYMAEDPSVLLKLYDEYLEKKQIKRREIKNVIKQLTPLYEGQFVTPKVSFYRGVEGAKRIMREVFSGDCKEVRNIMVIDEMLDVVGIDWFKKFVKTIDAGGIKVSVLRVAGKMTYQSELDKERLEPLLKNTYRRVLPKSIVFTVTVWIYDNKIAYFSSEKEGYAMIIESEEFTTMHRAMFDYFWSVSMPLDEYLNKFES